MNDPRDKKARRIIFIVLMSLMAIAVVAQLSNSPRSRRDASDASTTTTETAAVHPSANNDNNPTVTQEYRTVYADQERLEYEAQKVFRIKEMDTLYKFRGLHMVSHVETDGSTTFLVCGEFDRVNYLPMGFTRFVLDTKYGDVHLRRDWGTSISRKNGDEAFNNLYAKVCN